MLFYMSFIFFLTGGSLYGTIFTDEVNSILRASQLKKNMCDLIHDSDKYREGTSMVYD